MATLTVVINRLYTQLFCGTSSKKRSVVFSKKSSIKVGVCVNFVSVCFLSIESNYWGWVTQKLAFCSKQLCE